MPKPPELVLPDRSQPERVYAELIVAGRFKEIAAQLFDSGTFDRTTQAILEFTDNAVAARDKDGGQTRVLVAASPNRLRVAAFDEKGMEASEIAGIFRMGETNLPEDEIGLNTKGSGFKLGVFALAKDLDSLTAKKPDSPNRFRVSAPGLGDETVDFKGTIAIVPESAPEGEVAHGIVDVVLTGMKWKSPPSATELARNIGITYAPLMADEEGKWTQQIITEKGRARITLMPNGNLKEIRDKVQVYVYSGVGKKTIQARPPEIHYRQDTARVEKVVKTSADEPLYIKAGVLDLTKMSAGERRRDKPAGGHLFYDGRLVERGVYPPGQDMRDTRVRDRLRFEVDITYVKGIKGALQMNKSSGVREGPERQRILSAVEPVLDPLVEAIKTIDASTVSAISPHLREQLNIGRRIADAALRRLIETGELEIDDATLGRVVSGTLKAQDRPEPGQASDKGQPPRVGIQGTGWKDQQPRTLAQRSADPTIPRKRLTPYQIRSRSLEDQVTSAVTVEGGKAYLDINDRHPMNQLPELIGGLDRSAGALAAAHLGLIEEARQLGREIANGDEEKAFALEQAILWNGGHILADEPGWKFLESKARSTPVKKKK